MITPTKKPGFYRVPLTQERLQQLIGVPGLTGWDLDEDLCIRLTSVTVPRNVLTLIDDPSARAILANTKAPDWNARNAHFEPLGVKLRTTQHQAIDFIENRRGTLLADDMRVGKTGSCVGSHDPALGPLVVIGPLSSRGVWLGWFRRMFPGVSVGVVVGKKFNPEILKHPIIFAHYDILSSWQSAFKIGTLVFDEAHALTNPSAKRTEAATIFALSAQRVIAATGTPIWNRPAGMWSILSLVCPGEWGNYYEFADRYGAPVSTAYGKRYEGVSHPEELHARLGDVMIRRRWQEVNQDLPPISRSVVVADIDEGARKKLDILAGKLKGERSNTAANLAAYRRMLSKVKLRATRIEAERVLAAGEPVVVWAWHKEFADDIATALGTPYIIHGDVNADERERRMQAWKDSPTPMALVATMAVGQVAIDLSHAKFCVFGEIDWTPAIVAQTEMRTFDATRPMHVAFVIANHIVDQRIVRALVAKLSAADPLGVAAAQDSIDALRDALMGPEDPGDLDRLLQDMIASLA